MSEVETDVDSGCVPSWSVILPSVNNSLPPFKPASQYDDVTESDRPDPMSDPTKLDPVT